MEMVYFWVILGILVFISLMGIGLIIYTLYIGSLLVKVANLLKEVRGIVAELRYIQLARLRGRAPGEPSGLVDLDQTSLPYDPRLLPPDQQNL